MRQPFTSLRREWETRKRRHVCKVCPWTGWWIPGEAKLCPKCGDAPIEEDL